MPLGPGVRFRFKRMKGGRKQRLAFRGSKVVEVVNYSKAGRKGKTHLTGGK